MLAVKRFILCGLTHLAASVAQALSEHGVEIVVIRGKEGDDFLGMLGKDVKVISAGADRRGALQSAGIKNSACLLALSENEMDNLKAAVLAYELAPNLPVVIRAFDPMLAEQLGKGLNIRRAYSVSVLAAPALAAAVLGDEALATIRLGDQDVTLCSLTVRPGSPLAGKTEREILKELKTDVLAKTDAAGVWRQAAGDEDPLKEGQQFVAGGLVLHAMELVRLNNRTFDRNNQRAKRDGNRPQPPPAERATFLPMVATAFAVLLLFGMTVFSLAMHLHPVDAFYFVITTATTTGYGDIHLRDQPHWIKVFASLFMICSGALLAILFTHLASVATSRRIEARMGWKAKHLSRHVVLAGLGNIGYGVQKLLSDLKIETAVIERSADARFVDEVRQRSVVFSGDVRLPETLIRAGVREAAAMIACTNDDLANIQSCLHARRLNPNIRTVSAIYDAQIGRHISATFQISAAVSMPQVTTVAFVGAAMDARAPRHFRCGEMDYMALRHTAAEPVSAEEIGAWRKDGLRILAFQRNGGPVQTPAEAPPTLESGDTVILAGPEVNLRLLLMF